MSAEIQLHFRSQDGTVTTVHARPEGSLMEAAVRNNIDGILAQCGGALACATCHVFVMSDWADVLDPPSDIEDELLECLGDRRAESRLSCQIRLRPELEGLIVELPNSQI